MRTGPLSRGYRHGLPHEWNNQNSTRIHRDWAAPPGNRPKPASHPRPFRKYRQVSPHPQNRFDGQLPARPLPCAAQGHPRYLTGVSNAYSEVRLFFGRYAPTREHRRRAGRDGPQPPHAIHITRNQMADCWDLDGCYFLSFYSLTPLGMSYASSNHAPRPSG